MKINVIFNVIRLLYKELLREELVKLTTKTESKIDDYVIDLLDKLLFTNGEK